MKKARIKKRKKKKLAQQALEIFKKRGNKALEKAKQEILHEKISYKPLYEAIEYFMQETWYGVQHPALISLACEAVGGNPEDTTRIGAAMTLLAGAADVHDDIIDKSKTKGSRPTVVGKFGENIALLVGDILLFKGLMMLNEACEKLTKAKRQKILELIKKAFFELVAAEAKELKFKGRNDVSPEECFNMIKEKASISGLYGRIGAIIGGGNINQVKALGCYGEALGILTTVRDDFIDIFEPDELKNRIVNECLPLPILYAMENEKIKEKILLLLKKEDINEKDASKIVEMISNIKEVNHLKKEMNNLLEKTLLKCYSLNKNLSSEIEVLLKSTLEDL